jgi:hypothetical protein
MSQLRPILKPILVATLPVYGAVSLILISMVSTVEIVGFIAVYYPQNALSALSLIFLLMEAMVLYNMASRRSDKPQVWNNARIQLPLHWRRAILDVITWVRGSKLVRVALYEVTLVTTGAVAWGTVEILKAVDASIFLDLCVALIVSFVCIFLFTAGLFLYRSALAPVDVVGGEALNAIIDALPTIGPRGIESLSRDRSLSYSPRIMRLLMSFMALACAGSAIASVAPFVGFAFMVVPGLYLSGISMILVTVVAFAPLVSRKKSSLLRAFDAQGETE